MKFFLLYISIGAGLLSCSSVSIRSKSASTPVVFTQSSPTKLDSMVVVYKDSVDNEMSEILASNESDLIAVKKPSGSLSNWLADAIFTNQTKTKRLSEPVFCLLNHGGIRSTINKGNVTLGDIYKVMPFDNEIVWVRMSIEVLPEIAEFIRNRGGDPISNAIITNEGLIVNGLQSNHTHVWIITSDYLLNGGDNMSFFKKGVDINYSGVLLRDALIEETKIQKTLVFDSLNRMQF